MNHVAPPPDRQARLRAMVTATRFLMREAQATALPAEVGCLLGAVRQALQEELDKTSG